MAVERMDGYDLLYDLAERESHSSAYPESFPALC